MKNLKNYLKRKRYQKILRKIEIPEEGSVLDVSCGNGNFLAEMHKVSSKLTLHGLDMGEVEIKEAQSKYSWGTFVVGDSSMLSYSSNSFGRVFCLVTLHHYEFPEQVFKEISRVLARGGVFYLIDAFPKYFLTQKIYNYFGCSEPYHFEKYYLQNEVISIAERSGLKLIEDVKINTVPRLRALGFRKV